MWPEMHPPCLGAEGGCGTGIGGGVMGKKADTQMVFQRYEIKYLLTRKQREKIMAAMKPYMALDQY